MKFWKFAIICLAVFTVAADLDSDIQLVSDLGKLPSLHDISPSFRVDESDLQDFDEFVTELLELIDATAETNIRNSSAASGNGTLNGSHNSSVVPQNNSSEPQNSSSVSGKTPIGVHYRPLPKKTSTSSNKPETTTCNTPWPTITVTTTTTATATTTAIITTTATIRGSYSPSTYQPYTSVRPASTRTIPPVVRPDLPSNDISTATMDWPSTPIDWPTASTNNYYPTSTRSYNPMPTSSYNPMPTTSYKPKPVPHSNPGTIIHRPSTHTPKPTTYPKPVPVFNPKPASGPVTTHKPAPATNPHAATPTHKVTTPVNKPTATKPVAQPTKATVQPKKPAVQPTKPAPPPTQPGTTQKAYPGSIADDQNYIKQLWQLENASKVGWNPRTQRWVGNAAPERGGTTDYGPGLKLPYKAGGYTQAEIDQALRNKILQIEAVLRKNVAAMGKNYDTLSEKQKMLLVDYSYNTGSAFGVFPQTSRAIVNGDINGMLQGYKRWWFDKSGRKLEVLNRNIWTRAIIESMRK